MQFFVWMFVFNSLEQTPRGNKCYFLSIIIFFELGKVDYLFIFN